MARSLSQTQGNSKPMFMLTLGESDSAVRQVSLKGPAETGLPQEAIDLMAATTKSQGDAFYKNGEWEKARDTYMEAAGLMVSDPKLHTTLILNCAAANINLGRWEEVLCNTSEVLEVDPKSIKALFRSARALRELKDLDEALDCCNRALKLEPHNQYLREERQAAKRGAREQINPALSLLRKTYEYYHLRVIHNTSPSAFLPFFDPPLPNNYKTAPLLCSLLISYAERYAVDTIGEFPSNEPLHRLLDTLLPGPGGGSSVSPTSQISPEAKLTRVYIPPTRKRSPADLGMDHPNSWDPNYEFRPSTVSAYAETHDGKRIYIKPGMSLTSVFAEAKRLGTEEKLYIEIKNSMVPIYVFRNGSEAEKKWKDRDYKALADLSDPKYSVTKEVMEKTSSRARYFNSGPLERAVNLRTSDSYAAREILLKGERVIAPLGRARRGT